MPFKIDTQGIEISLPASGNKKIFVHESTTHVQYVYIVHVRTIQYSLLKCKRFCILFYFKVLSLILRDTAKFASLLLTASVLGVILYF